MSDIGWPSQFYTTNGNLRLPPTVLREFAGVYGSQYGFTQQTGTNNGVMTFENTEAQDVFRHSFVHGLRALDTFTNLEPGPMVLPPQRPWGDHAQNALSWGFANETYADNPVEQHMMDLHNNGIGVDLAKEFLDSRGGTLAGATNQDFADFLANKINTEPGLFIFSETDGRITDPSLYNTSYLPTSESLFYSLLGGARGSGEFLPNLLETLQEKFPDIVPDSCFGPEVPIDMWPLDPEFAPDPNNPFKQYDQEAVRAKIWKKPIELIRVGDYVVSHDKNGNMVPGYVPRTFQNSARILLNFHGTRVTPGHVYYRPDSKKADKYETLIDILRDDGIIETVNGKLLRAATNAPVSGPLDGFVQAITGTRRSDGAIDPKDAGRIRLGTRFIVTNGKYRKSYTVADLIKAGGGVVGEDELIRVEDGDPMPFLWDFGETLPKPEDFVLECSNVTLGEIQELNAHTDDTHIFGNQVFYGSSSNRLKN